MYLPASLIAAAIIVIVLSGIALITWAHRRGHAAGADEYRQLIKIKDENIAELLYTTARERSDAAQAMEELEAQHQKERRHMLAVRDAVTKDRNEALGAMHFMRNDRDKISAESMCLLACPNEQERAIQTLQASCLSDMEITLIDSMTQKLRLASPALHATQQFAAAKQAKVLAGRGAVLLARLRSDKAEDAA